MFKSAIEWFKSLSKVGKTSVVVVALSAASAMASPNPQTPQVQKPKVEATSQTKPPVTTNETVTETEPVLYNKTTAEDATLAKGTTRVSVTGVNGIRTKTYTVTKVDGVETKRDLTDDEVTTPAVDEVTLIGTYVAPPPAPAQSCHPNYTGACVPIASDVDCSSGSGNGPAYVVGPVRVVGPDIYDLDRDGNGIGCENG